MRLLVICRRISIQSRNRFEVKKYIVFKEAPHFTRNEFSPGSTMDLKTFVQT